jgi:squalene-associated FAD-dependent desaturase
MSTPSGDPVLVVGAGLAGISAAVHLSMHGIPVCLFEQRPHGGGRAYSFADATTGETIDNGQHVLIPANVETMQFLETIGSRHLLHSEEGQEFHFHHPRRGKVHFRLPFPSTPARLLQSVLTTNLLAPLDRLRLIRGGLALQHAMAESPEVASLSVLQWLQLHGQSGETIRSFWEPLAVAIMNERTSFASATLFLRCLQRAFDADHAHHPPHPASLLIPTVGLSDLFVHPACKYISDHGGRVNFGMRVVGVVTQAGRAAGVRLANGTNQQGSAVVLAVPPWSIEELLPPAVVLPGLEKLTPSPIVSIHLWFHTNFMREASMGVIGRTIQWVFNRRVITPSALGGGHVSCVFSAAHELTGATNDEITSLAMADLHAVFGTAASEPVHSLVIREKRATFSPRHDTESVRPNQQTCIPNFYLAGDWTATGLPGTIESAVWSGKYCAQLITNTHR